MSNKVLVTEVRKAFRDVRRFLAESQTMLDAGDLDRAYAAAESAQMAAFDAKDLIRSGGHYDAEANKVTSGP